MKPVWSFEKPLIIDGFESFKSHPTRLIVGDIFMCQTEYRKPFSAEQRAFHSVIQNHLKNNYALFLEAVSAAGKVRVETLKELSIAGIESEEIYKENPMEYQFYHIPTGKLIKNIKGRYLQFSVSETGLRLFNIIFPKKDDTSQAIYQLIKWDFKRRIVSRAAAGAGPGAPAFD